MTKHSLLLGLLLVLQTPAAPAQRVIIDVSIVDK